MGHPLLCIRFSEFLSASGETQIPFGNDNKGVAKCEAPAYLCLSSLLMSLQPTHAGDETAVMNGAPASLLSASLSSPALRARRRFPSGMTTKGWRSVKRVVQTAH